MVLRGQRSRRRVQEVEDLAGTARARRPQGGFRRWWRRRRPIKSATVWTHRWTALVLGLVLLVVCTSGVPLLWHEEIVHAQHPEAYRAAGPATMSFDEVEAVVARHDPDFKPQSLYHTQGVIVADDFESGRRVTVDPSNGRVLADFNPVTEGGFVSSTMGLMYNLHLCLLSCEEYPGYQKWLAAQVPSSEWAGFEGEKITWGGLLLGVMGLLLLFLALSGVWLWWPGFKHWVRGVRVRWRKGRYARDYDLHQVAGMIALPLLLLWAATGMGYEFGFVEKAWYQAVPGEAAEEVVLESAESKQPDIGLAAAVAAAQRVAGTNEQPKSVDLPHADEPTSTYGIWFAGGFDPYQHFDYAGDQLVSVDRHDAGKAVITYGDPSTSMAQELWQDYNFPAHSGMLVNGWWRIIWAVLGLVPLLLAITGLSTWFWTRGVRKRRRRRAAEAAVAEA
jgi:uncharacterized iron-regulated membrane protein